MAVLSPELRVPIEYTRPTPTSELSESYLTPLPVALYILAELAVGYNPPVQMNALARQSSVPSPQNALV